MKTQVFIFIILFVLTSILSCGPIAQIGTIGWYNRYGLSKKDLLEPENASKIAKALSDSNPRVCIKAIYQLNLIGPAAKPVVPILAETVFLRGNQAVWKRGQNALLNIGYDPEQIIPVMEKALHHNDDNIRRNTLDFYRENLQGNKDFFSLIPTINLLTMDKRGTVKRTAEKIMRNFARYIDQQTVPKESLDFFAYMVPKYFNGYRKIDMAQYGILPITITLSNNSDTNIEINTKRIYLLDNTGKRIYPAARDTVFETMRLHHFSTKGFIGNRAIENNLSNKFFTNITLSKNEKISKTIFFHIPPSQKKFKGWLMRIVATKQMEMITVETKF